MAELLQRGTLFNEVLLKDLIVKVQGNSALTKLSNQTPIAFNGNETFVFSMDKEIDIVAENGKKSNGGITLETVTMRPIKVEYGARITDEFMFAAEEEQINIIRAFNEGFAKKIARGLDLMAIHGINPRTGTASEVIGNNCFEKLVDQSVTLGENPDANVEAAVGLIRGAGGEVSGMALDPSFGTLLAAHQVNGVKMFPQLAWGAAPDTLNGIDIAVSNTVGNGGDKKALIGDFRDMFKWGYAKNVMTEIIPYGDPDNSGVDLKGYNQVYLRAEAYLGWGILDPKSFALIKG